MLFLCIKIFFARILDVSLGTVRTIFTVKGKSLIASLIGFIEICIWFTIVREALNTDETSLWIMVSYAAGYATGTYIGGKLSNKIIKTNFSVQVITSNLKLAELLRGEGYAVSLINIQGQEEKTDKYMLFIEIRNKNLTHLKEFIRQNDDKAFVVVNETKFVQNGFIK
ncbi:MAG: DUF2179 domain-containing protein [Bacilli bacterium]|nr:DUF2179 domain-containing protein [Bacilli bacterium]